MSLAPTVPYCFCGRRQPCLLHPGQPARARAKVALRARCDCARRPTVPVRVFAEVAARLRARLGQLPPEILALPLADVRCREKRCDRNVPLLIGDLLGYE